MEFLKEFKREFGKEILEKRDKGRRVFRQPTVSYNFRLTPMEYNALGIVAQSRGLRMAAWLRLQIHEHYERILQNKMPFDKEGG